MRAFVAAAAPLPRGRSTTSTSTSTSTSTTAATAPARAELTSRAELTPRALPGERRAQGGAPSLYDVLLAGTHDSAAYTARPDLLSRTAPPVMLAGAVRALTARTQTEFALTQHLSVRQQLDAGARFLDLRISKRAGTPEDIDEFWTIHGMVLCVPLAEVVAQLNSFELSRAVRTRTQVQSQARKLPQTNAHSRLSTRDAPVVLAVRCYALSAHETHALGRFLVSELVGGVYVGDAAGLARVPVFDLPPFILAGVSPSRLDAEWGADVWTDTYCSTKKIAFLEEALATAKRKPIANDTPPRNLLVLGWTVTPNVVDVALRFMSWGILRRTVMEEAADMNELFDNFATQRASEILDKANVVFFDCFSEREAFLVKRITQFREHNNSSYQQSQPT